jgi:hypothetical protein
MQLPAIFYAFHAGFSAFQAWAGRITSLRAMSSS